MKVSQSHSNIKVQIWVGEGRGRWSASHLYWTALKGQNHISGPRAQLSPTALAHSQKDMATRNAHRQDLLEDCNRGRKYVVY